MGEHSTIPGGPVVRPVLATALSLTMVAAGAYLWAGSHSSADADPGESLATATATAPRKASCDEVVVAADAALVPTLRVIADRFNRDTEDRCAVTIDDADSPAVLDAYSRPDSATNVPTAWIPESSVWLAELEERTPDASPDEAVSLVYSPVVLGVRLELEVAAHGAMTWMHVPNITYANAFEAYGHTDVAGSIRLAMPAAPRSDATQLAAQAFAVAASGGPHRLTTTEVVRPDVDTGLRQLVHAPPKAGDDSAEAAVTALATAPDMTSAKIRSVPISEQRLHAVSRTVPVGSVTAIRPLGATPVLDFPVIRPAEGVSDGSRQQADRFLEFAQEPAQISEFVAQGFRSGEQRPEPGPVVKFPAVETLMPAADPAAAVAVRRIVRPTQD